MKNRLAILSLGLIIAGCVAPQKPAPFEMKGAKFYGKGAQQNEEYVNQERYDSDVNDDFSYKGRSGISNGDDSYLDDQPDYSNPPPRSSAYRPPISSDEITKKPLDSGITSSRLAPPPPNYRDETIIDDHIDAYEDENISHGEDFLDKGYKSSSVKVPTSRDKLTYDEPEEVKSKSSDYLDLSSVEKKNEGKKPEKKGYSEERTDKLKGVFPKEKPEINDSDETSEEGQTKPVLQISAKEKPKSLTHEEEEVEEAKVEKKPQVKEAEKKTEKKSEPIEESKKVALKAEEESDFVSVPSIAPTPKEEIKKPEVKKVEEKDEAKIEPKVEPKKLEVASVKSEPDSEVKKTDIASIPRLEPASAGPVKFKKPVDGKIIQEFGGSSDGITIQAPEGTSVKAAAGGEVVYSGNELKGYGNMIVIKHSNGYLTAYSHLEDLKLKKGTKVTQGDVIGKVGKTGNVQSPQLHFAVRRGRSAVNPRDYLN